MFSWRAEVRPGVWVAFTDAAAGNLALHVGDDPAQVRRRRAGIEAALGLSGRPFRYMNQVHGNAVAGIGAAAAAGNGTGADAADAATADAPTADSLTADSLTADAPTADAMVSLGEPLAVMVADCVPIVLVGDRGAGATPVLAVVHAGRPGVASGVVPAAVARMRGLGAAGLSAWIGPSVCGGCYEVPEDMRDDVAARVPAAWCTTSRGTPGLDLPAAVRSQLQGAGVRVEYSGNCTLEDEQLFSFR
ncbi:polyphenol oxidase family protein, partial [uncultured Arthrobacter sp.]|uniref:polyphenol oxidase family protein n=1 Tax=uncultured Arthrobacter sp. TaxID=114050 RepID=UPI0032170649